MCISSGNQTWLAGKYLHDLSVTFRLKPLFIGDCPLPHLITGGDWRGRIHSMCIIPTPVTVGFQSLDIVGFDGIYWM